MTINSKPLLIGVLFGLLVIVQRLAPDSDSPINDHAQQDQAANATKTVSGKVERVVDGDSLYVRGEKKQIRLWAVDAPETSEQGYAAARAELRSLAFGKYLQCEVKDVDKYGRTVARCEDVNGRDINKAMLDSGKAKEYCRFSRNYYGHCD